MADTAAYRAWKREVNARGGLALTLPHDGRIAARYPAASLRAGERPDAWTADRQFVYLLAPRDVQLQHGALDDPTAREIRAGVAALPSPWEQIEQLWERLRAVGGVALVLVAAALVAVVLSHMKRRTP